MVTELFGAILTLQARIRFFGEAFGVKVDGKLPTQKKQERKEKEAPSIYMRNKDKRGEHHWEVPIIYSTHCATFIFHYPRLERAEKEDTYHIAHGICK